MMKRCKKTVKTVVLTTLLSMSMLLAGCGDDSEKVYLDEIKVKDYVKLGEYKGVNVTQAQPEVTDEERDAYVDSLLCMNPDRAVIEGDTVNIDYVGKLDGVAFEGGTAAGYDLTIGSGQFIDGFEDGLIGTNKGETVDLNLTFPEEYHSEDLAGQEVVFTVTVNSIMAAEPQELNDANVQKLELGVNTVDELKQYAYDQLYPEKLQAYNEQVEFAVIDSLIANWEFKKEPPKAMIDRYEDVLMENLSMQASAYGMTFDQLMQLYGMDEAAYTEEIRSQAVQSAKQYIILQAIADAENLNVTDEEWNKEIEAMAAVSGYESLEEFKELMDARGYKEYMMGLRVMEMLRENAVVSAE